MGKGEPIPNPALSAGYPPLRHTWTRITQALSAVPELPETLSPPASSSSLHRLEKSLLARDESLRLPRSVKDHFHTHDGQDPFATHSGAVFGNGEGSGLVWGLWVMSVEEVQAEWGFWRKLDNGVMPGDAFSASDFRIAAQRRGDALVLEDEEEVPLDEKRYDKESGGWSPQMSRRRAEKKSWMDSGMSSCPAGWVREVYTSPGWIPLLSDRAGNYIGIDLDPPPFADHNEVDNAIGGGQGSAKPTAGQVIAFGREIDEKVVLWRGDGEQGWGKWLAAFAEDLEEGEFAEVGGRVGRTHRRDRAGSEGGSSWRGVNGSSDEETESDGLGDVGYFNDGSVQGYGESGERGAWRGWRLKGHYRGMGVIAALCHRSRARWAEVGLFSSREGGELSLHSVKHELTSLRMTVASPPAQSPSARSPSVRSPPLLLREAERSTEQLLHSPAADDASSSTEPDGPRSPDPLASPAADTPAVDSARPGSPPDAPVAFVTPPSPVLDTAQRHLESRDPQDNHRLSQDTLRRPTGRRASGGSGPVRRSRPPPPPPASSLGLPTMDDLMRGTTLTDLHDEDAWSPSGTAAGVPLVNGDHYGHREGRASFSNYLPDSPTSPKLVGSPLSLASLPLVGRLSSEGRRSRQGSKDVGISLGALGRAASSSDSPILPTSSLRPSTDRRGSGHQPMIDDHSPIQVLATTEGVVGAGPPHSPQLGSPLLGSPLLGSPAQMSAEFTPAHAPPTPPPPTARRETKSPVAGGLSSPLAKAAATSTDSLGTAEAEFESAPSSIVSSRSPSVMA